MKVIDCHAHIFPPKIEEKAVKSISDFYWSAPMSHGGSPEELLEAGAQIGVEKYLVFSTATVPQQVVSINDFIIGESRTHEEFWGVGTMHIDFEDFEAELWRIWEAGIKGIKLHTDFQRFNIDDERMMPVYAQMEDMGMFLVAHIGDPRTDYSHPRRMANIARRFPKMKCLAAHFGGWGIWDSEPRDCLQLPNVYVDTSSTFFYASRESSLREVRRFDLHRVLFATDFPMGDHKKELDFLLTTGLTDSELDDVLYNNAMAFYHE